MYIAQVAFSDTRSTSIWTTVLFAIADAVVTVDTMAKNNTLAELTATIARHALLKVLDHLLVGVFAVHKRKPPTTFTNHFLDISWGAVCIG